MAGLVQDLLLCLFNAEVKQWGSLDSFCSHTWDVQKKKESFNRNKEQLHVALCVCALALFISPLAKPAAGRRAQPKLMFTVRIRPGLHVLFLPPPSPSPTLEC